MDSVHFLVFSLLVAACSCQRPSYAGTRPIGYPEYDTTTSAPSSAALDTRLGPSEVTERLPVEALGDRQLVQNLRKLPLDNQPFWLLNWQILEDNRGKPKTYPLRQNSYLDPIPTQRPIPWSIWQ